MDGAAAADRAFARGRSPASEVTALLRLVNGAGVAVNRPETVDALSSLITGILRSVGLALIRATYMK